MCAYIYKHLYIFLYNWDPPVYVFVSYVFFILCYIRFIFHGSIKNHGTILREANIWLEIERGKNWVSLWSAIHRSLRPHAASCYFKYVSRDRVSFCQGIVEAIPSRLRGTYHGLHNLNLPHVSPFPVAPGPHPLVGAAELTIPHPFGWASQ